MRSARGGLMVDGEPRAPGQREVAECEGRALADAVGVPFAEVSSASGQGVEPALLWLAWEAVRFAEEVHTVPGNRARIHAAPMECCGIS